VCSGFEGFEGGGWLSRTVDVKQPQSEKGEKGGGNHGKEYKHWRISGVLEALP
jgi:hypothetical protein